MILKDAMKLHNEDEVTLKKTGEIVSVLNAWPSADKKTINIEYATRSGGYGVTDHKKVK